MAFQTKTALLTSKLYIASDHAGFDLKQRIIEILKGSLEITDLGCDSLGSVDYPDYAECLASHIKPLALGCPDDYPDQPLGILVCGTGTGMAITANRFPWVRASVFEDNIDVVRLARSKNHINILCLGAQIIDEGKLENALELFLTEATSKDRHARRVTKMSSIQI